jgi:serine/threonine-protein kinase
VTADSSSPERRSFPGIVPGEIIGQRYCVDDQLGRGGMGMVFAAHEVSSGQRVAIKVMRPSEDMDLDAVRRFAREGRLAGSIGNPHIARVLDGGWLSESAPYLVLERLDGRSLASLLHHEGTLPVPQAVDWALQVCEGIAAAHAAGVVHRDLKPSNLFIAQQPDGSTILKVLDFGIAKAARDELRTLGSDLTQSQLLLGSPRYMSPEQLRSARDVDARTDIWALGLILHQMLTGKSAFPSDSVGAHLAAIIERSPVALRAHLPAAPSGLERAIARCLQKDLARRHQDMAELARALLPFASDPVGAAARAQRVAAMLAAAGALSSREALGEPSMASSDDGSSTPVPMLGDTVADHPTRRPLPDSTTNVWTPMPRTERSGGRRVWWRRASRRFRSWRSASWR